MDDDGLSVVCNPHELILLESLHIKSLNVSPSRWRALEINVVGSATEFPGAVYFLADTLSKSNISILHISTFESEIFLVQEQDIDSACEVLRNRTETLSKYDLAKILRRNSSSANNVGEPEGISALTVSEPRSVELGLTNVDATSLCENMRFKDGFVLCALPCSVMLARLSEDFSMHQCGEILVQLAPPAGMYTYFSLFSLIAYTFVIG
jgi:hypothetical protein